MKKKLLILISIVLVMLSLALVVSAKEVTPTISSQGGARGENVTFTVAVTASAKSGSIGVTEYDTDVLEYVSAEWALPGSPTLSSVQQNGNAILGVFAYTEEQAMDGVIFKVTFKVKDSAAFGTSDVKFRVQLRDSANQAFYSENLTTTVTVACTSHSFDNKYDDNKHWSECSNCGAKQNEGAHKFDNACDSDCSECAYTRATEHTWDDSKWMSNGLDHWHECTACHEKKDSARHGYTDVCDTTCDVCEKVRLAPHQYGDYETSDTQHWKVCELCATASTKANHVWDNACDTECTCGYTRVTEHSYGDWVAGETEHYKECSSCGNIAENASHTAGDWIVDSPAQPGVLGSQHKECTVCGATVETGDIPALPVPTETESATETESETETETETESETETETESETETETETQPPVETDPPAETLPEGKVEVICPSCGEHVVVDADAALDDCECTECGEALAKKEGGFRWWIILIIILAVLILAAGGFALYWFVIAKKTWDDFLDLFRGKE